MDFKVESYTPSKISSGSTSMPIHKVDIDIEDYEPSTNFSDTTNNQTLEEFNLSEFVTDDISYKEGYASSNTPEEVENQTIQEKEQATNANIGNYTELFINTMINCFGEGFLSLGEGVVDSHIYGTTLTMKHISVRKKSKNNTEDEPNRLSAYEYIPLEEAFGLEEGYDDRLIGYDWSESHQAMLDMGPTRTEEEKELIEKIENGFLGNIAKNAGKNMGYKALAAVPFVGIALCAIGGAGARTEESINKQMEETGCVNDFYVFFESLAGSVEGFAGGFAMKNSSNEKFTDKINLKKIRSGFKKMSGDKFKKGVSEIIKSIPKVSLSTVKELVKNPETWIDAGAKITDKLSTIYESGDFPIIDFIFPLSIFTEGDTWKKMGEMGIEYIVGFDV